MKLRISILSIGLSALLCVLSFSVNVKAYEGSYIERIYITSDTSLGALKKEYVPATIDVVDKDGTFVKVGKKKYFSK